MGVVVRDGLTSGLVGEIAVSYLTLGAWTLIVGGITARALRQRR
jgi:hypothetical protein